MCVEVPQAKHEFSFDDVLNEDTTQESVFSSCAASIVDGVLDGYNGCVFAYGQTGAGKTHTMSGPPLDDYENRGICKRSIEYLFHRAKQSSDAFSIRMSVLEIYNETLTDLLHDLGQVENAAGVIPDAPKLTIVDLPTGVSVPALFLMPLASEEDAYSLLFDANNNRMVAEHQLNRRSSRSHIIYTLYLTQTRSTRATGLTSSAATVGDKDVDVIQSKLNMVDLAGSERVDKTGSSGVVQKEANHINKSLSFLEQVVLALTQSKREHIPYRQSKLTYLLKDSIGGNCNTSLIACVWPHTTHLWETLSTLRFSTRMKCIENHPIRNSLVQKDNVGSSRKYVLQINALKRELLMRDNLCGEQAPWLLDLTNRQKTKTCQLARRILCEQLPVNGEGGEDFPMQLKYDIQSLSQVHYLTNLLKDVVYMACDNDPQRVESLLEQLPALASGGYAGSDSPGHRGKEAESQIFASKSNQNNKNRSVLEDTSVISPNAKQSPHGRSVEIPNSKYNSPAHGGYGSNVSSAESPVGGDRHEGDARVGEGEVHKPVDMPHTTAEPLPAEAKEPTLLSFDVFKEQDGSQLNASYERAKEQLKYLKGKMKTIVSVVNRSKTAIDRWSEELKQLEEDGNDGSGVAAANTKVELDRAKADYRSAYNDLSSVRKEVSDAQASKQQAMTLLVNGYSLASGTASM